MLQTASVAFREIDDEPSAWRVDVMVDGVVSGRIYRGGGTYLYFEGPDNDVIWSFADLDLRRLESRIRTTVIAE
jgi:hypothetical protein